MSPRAFRFKQLAAAQALLFATTLFGAVYHKAAALHGYCSAHGKRIHLEQRAGPADRSANDRLCSPCHVHGAHGCLFLDLLAQSSRHETWPNAQIERLVRVAQHLGPAIADYRPTLSPLRLAPKSSPPA
jgi:hypothetical protein